MKELNTIQTRLVARKNAKNAFANYNYRNLESIMEAVKPLLKETGCTITFSDDLVVLEGRIFCKSMAILKNEQGDAEKSVAFAEMDSHKGMSKEQCSGSSSSYARKYAICSLLAIDDNADVDSMDHTEEAPKKSNEEAELKRAIAICKTCQSVDDLRAVWTTYRKFQMNEKFIKAKEAKKAELTNNK